MSKILVLTLLSLLTLLSTKSSFRSNPANAHWAVLVAGSNGFWNYRHQSDIFHAYHILLGNGIPADKIIVFAYDDIANSSQNPFKGQVFNTPSKTAPGRDYYKGVKIDYKGRDVIPENFLSVLRGDKEKLNGVGSGRVLESAETDNVFIYFSDHGATGLIAFPNGELYANDLISTLKTMHENKSYHELVFYLEACESGSMFNKLLPAEWNIYATTAATPDQSSWATYCSPDDVVNGKHVGSCLGDEYSVNWMEDTDAHPDLKESLQEQFNTIFAKTKGSQAQQYGDITYTHKSIGLYQGSLQEVTKIQSVMDYFKGIFNSKNNNLKIHSDIELDSAKESRIDSRDARLHYLYERMYKNELGSFEELENELKQRHHIDEIFTKFNIAFDINILLVSNENTTIDFSCLKPSVENFKSICGNWNEYTLKYVKNISEACLKSNIENIAHQFADICQN